jgi:hypothetical protein
MIAIGNPGAYDEGSVRRKDTPSLDSISLLNDAQATEAVPC